MTVVVLVVCMCLFDVCSVFVVIEYSLFPLSGCCMLCKRMEWVCRMFLSDL